MSVKERVGHEYMEKMSCSRGWSEVSWCRSSHYTVGGRYPGRKIKIRGGPVVLGIILVGGNHDISLFAAYSKSE